MTLSNTPLVMRLQERYCTHAWRLRTLFAFDLALAQRACGQAIALGAAPPAQPGQGKAPQDRFVFIEQDDLASASPVLQGREFERAIGEISRGGIEPAGGAAVAQRVFFKTQRTLSRPSWTPVCWAKHGGEFAATPLGMERAMLEGVLIDEAIEVVFEFAGDFGRSAGARAIQQALGPFLGKALHPFAQGRIGQVEGGGDGGDVLARDHLTDGLSAAKDARLLGLLEQGI